MKIENEFAIIEQKPGSITITWKHPNTTEKPKIKAREFTSLDNAGLFIKPSDQMSDAKLMIDGKPLAEVINGLRAAITNIGGQLAALQTSETANHAAKIASRAASSGYDHDKHK